jgi:hypothetical protein
VLHHPQHGAQDCLCLRQMQCVPPCEVLQGIHYFTFFRPTYFLPP